MGKNNLKKLGLKSGKLFQVPKDIESNSDPDLSKPIFSFHYMVYGSSTCLSKCEKNIKSSLSDTLIRLSQSTWKEIKSKPKESLGFETIPRERFKKPFPANITPEVTIIVFRFSGSGRMAGFRRKDTYHIVQIGPQHNLY